MKNTLIVAPIGELNSRTLRLIRDIQKSLRRHRLVLVSNADVLAQHDPITPVVVPSFKRVLAQALVRTLGAHAPYAPPSAAYEEIITYLRESAHPIIALGHSCLNFVPSNIQVSLNPTSGTIQFSNGQVKRNHLAIGNNLFLYAREKGDPTYAEYVRDIITDFIDRNETGNSSLIV